MDCMSRVVVAASGSGRSLENLVNNESRFEHKYKIVGVILSKKNCRAFEIAQKFKIKVITDEFSKSVVPSYELLQWLDDMRPNWILLAGFLKIFPTKFPHNRWTQKIINIHPSLLPKFGGQGMYGELVHKAVINSADKISGATIHFVNDKYDDGSIISQSYLDIDENDDHVSLAKRVFELECKLYPQTLYDLTNGDLPLKKGKVKVYDFN